MTEKISPWYAGVPILGVISYFSRQEEGESVWDQIFSPIKNLLSSILSPINKTIILLIIGMIVLLMVLKKIDVKS